MLLLPQPFLTSLLQQRSITNPKKKPHLVLIYSEVPIDPHRTGHLVFSPASLPFPYFSSLSWVKETVFFPKDYNVLRRKGCLCVDFTLPSSTHTNTERKEKGIIKCSRSGDVQLLNINQSLFKAFPEDPRHADTGSVFLVKLQLSRRKTVGCWYISLDFFLLSWTVRWSGKFNSVLSGGKDVNVVCL